MPVKINKLEIENVKRVKAVKMEPSANGLTIIGGNNSEGKTSVLDAIAWALGGNSFKPSDPVRRGSATAPYLKVTMSNGLIVERKGKNSALTVTDPSGQRAGQSLLDSFVEKLALDLPRFLQANDKEKAQTLLNIIGVGPQLMELEAEEKQKYQERIMIGRIADQKQKFAAEQPYYPDAPEDLLSPADLIRQQQDILAINGRNQEYRRNLEELLRKEEFLKKVISGMEIDLQRKKEELESVSEAVTAGKKTVEELQDESTEEIERSIENIETINRKVRANLDKEKAEEDAKEYTRQYDILSAEIETVRQKKTDLLKGADLPLPDLAVQEGRLTYKGQQWDNMSGAEQLIVATAIVRKLNPECGFVLMDKLEQMDRKTLQEFGSWLDAEGLQVIATRVSTGEECQIIIEDGYGEMIAAPVKVEPTAPSKWKKGVF